MSIKFIKLLFILHCSMILICFNDIHASKLDVNIKKNLESLAGLDNLLSNNSYFFK